MATEEIKFSSTGQDSTSKRSNTAGSSAAHLAKSSSGVVVTQRPPLGKGHSIRRGKAVT